MARRKTYKVIIKQGNSRLIARTHRTKKTALATQARLRKDAAILNKKSKKKVSILIR